MCNLLNLYVFCYVFLKFWIGIETNLVNILADFFLNDFFGKIKEDGNQSNHEP